MPAIHTGANGDDWSRMLVIYSSGGDSIFQLPLGTWNVAIEKGNGTGDGRVVSGFIEI
jgi:hypothetical protein